VGFGSWALGAWRERLLTLRLDDGTTAFATRTGGCAAPAAPAAPVP